MNTFELFTMIYFVLEAYYEDVAKENENIKVVLGDMNPFVWEDCGSADPAVYNAFCRFMDNREITLENSLQIATEYVKTIDYADVSDAFSDMSENEWMTACKEYLNSEHKGKK